MPSFYGLTIADYSHELSMARFYVAPTIDTTGQLALQNAVSGISLGVIQTANLTISTVVSGSYPTDQLAQRELKVLVGYSDDVNGKKYTMTVPAPDVSLLTIAAGTDLIDITTGTEVLALVSAIETYGRSELGNAITVNYMRLVGRNN